MLLHANRRRCRKRGWYGLKGRRKCCSSSGLQASLLGLQAGGLIADAQALFRTIATVVAAAVVAGCVLIAAALDLFRTIAAVVAAAVVAGGVLIAAALALLRAIAADVTGLAAVVAGSVLIAAALTAAGAVTANVSGLAAVRAASRLGYSTPVVGRMHAP